MIPSIALNFTAGLASLAKNHILGSGADMASNPHRSRISEAPSFASASERLPHLQLPNAMAVAMHRDNQAEFRRESMRSLHSAA